MVVLYGILFLVLFLIVWVIFVPVRLVCISNQDIYKVYQTGVFSVQIIPDERIRVRTTVFGIPIKRSTRKKEKPETPSPKEKSKRRKRRTLTQWRILMEGLLKSIRTDHARVNIDTGDPLTTALLIPAGVYISGGPVSLSGNFVGKVEADIALSIHLNRMVWPLLRFLI